jgi:methionyl-tRNA formyltransferase
VFKPVTPRDPDFLAALRTLSPDCIAVIAYGALLPPEALAIPTHGWVNLHFSLLPAWRGAAPVHHAILAGDDVTGTTTFQIVPALDAGPVYGTMTYTVPRRATTGEVLSTLSHDGARLLLDTLDAIESGQARPIAQTGDVTHAPRLTSADARIDWSQPWLAIDRRIRACTPAPGPWTTFRSARLGLGPLEDAVSPPSLPAGQILVDRAEVLVGTGTGAARLAQVRPASRGWMDAIAWARGARPRSGEIVGAEA